MAIFPAPGLAAESSPFEAADPGGQPGFAYTAMTAGPHRRTSAVTADLRAALGTAMLHGTFESSVAAVRRGDWVLFDAGKSGRVTASEPPIEPARTALLGHGRAVTTIRQGASLCFVASPGSSIGVDRFSPQAEPGPPGTLWDATGPGGRPLALFGPGSAADAAKALQANPEWTETAAARSQGRSDQATASIVALGEVGGGYAVIAAARRLASAPGVKWIDGGNLVDDPNDQRGRATLEATLASLIKAGPTLTVPYKNELRLTRDDQARLARAVPLVAANLTGPPGVNCRPYLVTEIGGTRIGLVGLADSGVLSRNHLVGRGTGWELKPEAESLAQAIAGARSEGATAIVVVTNNAPADLGIVQTVASRSSAVLSFEYDRGNARSVLAVQATGGIDRPLLVGTVTPLEVGRMTLTLDGTAGDRNQIPRRAVFETVQPTDREHADIAAAKQAIAAQAAFESAHADIVLPDSRRLSRPVPAYGSQEWSRMSAAAIRDAAAADVGILPVRHGGQEIAGEVPRYAALDWLPAGTFVAVTRIKGADLRRWVASLGSSAGLAGYNRATDRIGGRPLADREVYRVATSDSFAFSDTQAAPISEGTTVAFRLDGGRLVPRGRGVTVAEAVLAQMAERKMRHGGFTGAFVRELEAMLQDDGTALEPRWAIGLDQVDVSFYQNAKQFTEPFSEVSSTRLTGSTWTWFRAKAALFAHFDASAFAWENSALLDYDLFTAASPVQKTDEVRTATQWVGNLWALALPDLGLRALPFAELGYLTEITPGTSPKTGQALPRREEVTGTTGVVFRGAGWLRECKLGLEARQNLAFTGKTLEPGARLGLQIGQTIGPVDLALAGQVDGFLPTQADSASDLGIWSNIDAGAKVPLGGGLALRASLLTTFVQGKIPATSGVGVVYTPLVGISYGATWKPLSQVVY
jgi:hypothetical protein